MLEDVSDASGVHGCGAERDVEHVVGIVRAAVHPAGARLGVKELDARDRVLGDNSTESTRTRRRQFLAGTSSATAATAGAMPGVGSAAGTPRQRERFGSRRGAPSRRPRRPRGAVGGDAAGRHHANGVGVVGRARAQRQRAAHRRRRGARGGERLHPWRSARNDATLATKRDYAERVARRPGRGRAGLSTTRIERVRVCFCPTWTPTRLALCGGRLACGSPIEPGYAEVMTSADDASSADRREFGFFRHSGFRNRGKGPRRPSRPYRPARPHAPGRVHRQ